MYEKLGKTNTILSTSLVTFLLHRSELHGGNVVILRYAIGEFYILEQLLHHGSRLCLVGTRQACQLVGTAIGIGEVDHSLPALRHRIAVHAGVAHLLVWPIGVADVVLAHGAAEVGLPLHGVVTKFTHIHRAIGLVAEVDIRLDGLLGGRATVAMAGVHELRVELPVGEALEGAIPLRTAEQDDVVGIDLADHGSDALIKRLDQLVELLLVLKVVGERLVDELVTQDGGLGLVTVGNHAPDAAILLLCLLAFEEPGVAVAVVDVVARLSARGIVHVEDEVEIVGLAPRDDAVDAREAFACGQWGDVAHVVLVGEELVVERQTDGVGTGLGDEVDVGAGDVVVLELTPEAGRGLWADELAEHLVDHAVAIALLEAEHVALGIEPVAKVRAYDEELLAIGFDEVRSIDAYKLIGSRHVDCRRAILLTAYKKAGCQEWKNSMLHIRNA